MSRSGRVVTTGFHRRVYQVVRQIPEGRVSTYGDIAEALGARQVARHVGWALAALPEGESDVPWHRVINRKGEISYRGDFVRGEAQRLLLEAEGLSFDTRGRLPMATCRWLPPISIDEDRSLAPLNLHK